MFKLVRIDDDYHREIELKNGKQEIGRGQMFDVSDLVLQQIGINRVVPYQYYLVT